MVFKVIGTGSKGNSYVLEGSEHALILDAGINPKKVLQALKYRIDKVSTVLISHEHSDHAKYIKDYLVQGIPVYMNERLFDVYGQYPGAVYAKPFCEYGCGGFSMIPFPLPHNGIPNYGWYIEFEGERLAYMTDCAYSQVSLRRRKLNHLICEVNYCRYMVDRSDSNYEHRCNGHMELDTFLNDVLPENTTDDLKNIVIVHMSYTAANELKIVDAVTKAVNPGVNVYAAYNGLEVNFESEGK